MSHLFCLIFKFRRKKKENSMRGKQWSEEEADVITTAPIPSLKKLSFHEVDNILHDHDDLEEDEQELLPATPKHHHRSHSFSTPTFDQNSIHFVSTPSFPTPPLASEESSPNSSTTHSTPWSTDDIPPTTSHSTPSWKNYAQFRLGNLFKRNRTLSSSSNSTITPIATTTTSKIKPSQSNGSNLGTEKETRVSFVAERITTCDYFGPIPNYRSGYNQVFVFVDTIQKQIMFELDAHYKLILKFDHITGLDFQYSPCQPVCITIEVSQKPQDCPAHFKSHIYFLYLSKEQSVTYFDNLILQCDRRLYKLAVQSMPSWAVIVNRYSLPVYYSYRFRVFITMLLNIYIIISLLWGFYDLYKNIPFIGGYLRVVFSPIVNLLAPLKNNALLLLIPYAAQSFVNIWKKIYDLFFSNIPLWPMVQEVGKLFQFLYFNLFLKFVFPIFDVLRYLFKDLLFGSILTTLEILWSVVKLPFEIMKHFMTSFVGIMKTFSYLFAGIWNLCSTCISSLSWIISLLLRTVVYPVSKIRALFSQSSATLGQVQDITMKTSTLIGGTSTEQWRGYWFIVQEFIQPFQKIYFGFRRIVDSIYHYYSQKIKYRTKEQQRHLFIQLAVVVFFVAVLIYALVIVLVL